MKANSNKKKVVAGIVAVALIGAGLAAGATLFPRTIVQTKEVEKRVEVPGPTQYVDKVTTVEVPVNVTQEIKVDNGNLAAVEQLLYDQDGSVEFLTSDLKANEVNKIADRVIFINEAKTLAVQKVRNDAFYELNHKTVNTTELFRSDMRSLYVEDDSLTYDAIDFNNGDIEVTVPVTFRQNDERFKATFTVRIVEDKVDDLFLENVTTA